MRILTKSLTLLIGSLFCLSAAAVDFTGTYRLLHTAGAIDGSLATFDVEATLTNSSLPSVADMMTDGFVNEEGKFAMKMFHFGSGWGFFDLVYRADHVTVISSNPGTGLNGCTVPNSNGWMIWCPDAANATIIAVWDTPPPSIAYGCDDFCIIARVSDPVGVVTDTDGDGVDDPDDLCPDTAAGASVDANGCAWEQLDDDSDGVTNGSDLCPDTAAGSAVDADGCAWEQLDDDGDGVSNGSDACPGTAAGSAVDADGCAWEQLDEDQDGVLNGSDQCLGTAAGALVDANGCSGAQLVAGACPTTDSYKNHGQYVSCVAKAADAQVEAGLITDEEKDVIVSEAGGSDIGKAARGKGRN